MKFFPFPAGDWEGVSKKIFLKQKIKNDFMKIVNFFDKEYIVRNTIEPKNNSFRINEIRLNENGGNETLNIQISENLNRSFESEDEAVDEINKFLDSI